jgi:hypothetical protein
MSLANGKRKFNPRLLPPLIGLGLLLAIAMAILFSRGGQPRPTEEFDARVVRRVEQTPDFTYLELEDGDGTLWLATPRVDVQAGDRVQFASAKVFRDFEAPSLKRKFDRLLLVGELFKLDADGQPVALESTSAAHGRDLPEGGHGGIPGHGGMAGHDGMAGHGSTSAADVTVPKLEKAEGGQTLGEISASPSKFSGQTVKVRGIVVWTLPGMRLGQRAANWYRLQDGSVADPLVFTSTDKLEVGDVVVISGKLATDKDFGGGMSYKMIVEGASVTREAETKPADKKPDDAKLAGKEPADTKPANAEPAKTKLKEKQP